MSPTSAPLKSAPAAGLSPDPTAAAAAAALQQCADFIRQVAPDLYARPSTSMAGSSIGQHVRHALDHFAAAMSALDGAVIAYDHRERDTPIERDPGAALHLLDRLQNAARGVDGPTGAQPVRIRVMLSSAGDEATLSSTLARELAFATHHAIHHHAMIGAIAREHGIEPPRGFGRAPSTLHHEAPQMGAR